MHQEVLTSEPTHMSKPRQSAARVIHRNGRSIRTGHLRKHSTRATMTAHTRRKNGDSSQTRLNRVFLATFVCVGLAVLSGCAVGPKATTPSTPMQTAWKEGVTATSAPVLPREWWTLFGDETLNSYEKTAVEANQDLKRASARLSEARALLRVSRADLYPRISGEASYSRNRQSENRGLPPGQEIETDDFFGGFDLNYEVDLWGRVRNSVAAARSDATAVAMDLETALLSVTADVARTYCLIRSLDDERNVIEATIALRKDAVRLQQTRHEAGLINEVDVTRAKTELSTVEADLHAILRARARAEHALAVLCGQPAGAFTVPREAWALTETVVPAGLPSLLLKRRPDILEAENRLSAAFARIGVAKAAFFPTLKLTGTAGLASADLGTFLNWPSKVWSVGPSIHFPIFEAGRNRANLQAAEARHEQALSSYRRTILTAFQEVEDALSDLSTVSSQRNALGQALLSARDTASLARERYQRGLSSYLEVVDAERAALDAERQEKQLRGQRAISAILLVKALGGGWQDAPVITN